MLGRVYGYRIHIPKEDADGVGKGVHARNLSTLDAECDRIESGGDHWAHSAPRAAALCSMSGRA